MSEIISRLEGEFPYIQFMGFKLALDQDGRLYGKMPFQEKLIGNPIIPALHGGGIAGFMEATALATLIYVKAQDDADIAFRHLPRTINLTSDYLRPGYAKDSYAQASIHRIGGRYASVHVLAWQEDYKEPIAEAVGHFLVADWKKK